MNDEIARIVKIKGLQLNRAREALRRAESAYTRAKAQVDILETEIDTLTNKYLKEDK